MMDRDKIEKLLENTKLLALVFEALRDETPPAVTQSIKETFENINQALTLLRAKPSAGEYTKRVRKEMEEWGKKNKAKVCDFHSEGREFIEKMGEYQRESPNLLDASRAELKAKDEECEGLKKALEHIIEYWNKDENHGAMSDALDEILTTAEQALSPKGYQ